MVEFIAIIFRVVRCCRRVDIDDTVDPALLGERHRLRDDVLGLVVDDQIGAGEAGLFGLE